MENTFNSLDSPTLDMLGTLMLGNNQAKSSHTKPSLEKSVEYLW